MTRYITEPAREIPVAGEFDVIVCGGGPAGCAAALAAARAGARTLLLERNQFAGGIWTAGLMPWIIDHQNKTGIMAEWRAKLLAAGGGFSRQGTLGAPPEAVKFMLEDDLLKAGVRIRYGTTVAAAVVRDGKIACAVTESKSGREAWAGSIFIDCTGDGDLAALAGCRFDVGDDGGKVQPSSVNALVGGLELEEVRPFLVPTGKIPLRELLQSQGVDPSYAMPSLFHFGCGIFGWMAHHAYQVKASDADSVTQAAVAGREELQRQIAALRRAGGIWKDITLLATAANLGIREARRIKALATIGVADFGTVPEPGKSVCLSTLLPDVHATDAAHCKGVEPQRLALKPPLPLPWRAQISADRGNLLLAGRCIGGDFLSHASYRMTGTAVPLGEAAGRGAAWAAATGKPQEEWPDVPYFGGGRD